eukprot:13949533-Alexandrium_andersonii.AAC.1
MGREGNAVYFMECNHTHGQPEDDDVPMKTHEGSMDGTQTHTCTHARAHADTCLLYTSDAADDM